MRRPALPRRAGSRAEVVSSRQQRTSRREGKDLSALLLSSNLFLLAVPKIIKKVVILETVFYKSPAHRQWSHRPEKLILFSCKKSRQGKFKKIIKELFFWWGELRSALALKFGSNLVIKLHQIRTKLHRRARKRLFCLGNDGFAQQNPSVFLGGELGFVVSKDTLLFFAALRRSAI